MIEMQDDIPINFGAEALTSKLKMMETTTLPDSVIVDEYSVISVLNLIHVRDWIIFESVALESPLYFRALANAIDQFPEFNGMTILHAAVRYNAPLTIVTKMIQICPAMTSAKDCLGRTPLHVAAGMRVSPAVIKEIARANPSACIAVDEDGNTPLHFACDRSCVLFESPQLPQDPPDYYAVAALLSESTHAATIEDNDETTPVEHAILSGASIETVKLLQSAATKYLRSQSQKTKSEDEHHIVNFIKDRSQSKRRRLHLEPHDEVAVFAKSA